MKLILSIILFLSSSFTLAATPVFTKAQADAGAKTFKTQCALCHGSKLNNGGAPKLAGPEFLKKWAAPTVDDFYFIMHSTMPQTKPGSLTEKEALNLIAYILQQNNFKPGKKALALKELPNYTFKK